MPEIKSIIRVNYYSTTAPGRVFDPYDCSKQPTTGSGGNATKYCLQSRFYSCAMRVHCPIPEIGSECPVEDMAKVSALLACPEASGPSGLSSFANALPCAKKNGLDVDKIVTCFDPTDVSYTGPAVAAIDAVNNATDAAAIAYFPDVRVAGRKLQPGATPTAAGLIKAACAAFQGANPPTACATAVEQTLLD